MSTQSGAIWAVGWSHDHSTIAYFTDTPSGHQFWLQRSGVAPVPLSDVMQVMGRDGVEGDENLVAFSYDDRYVLFVDTAAYRLQVFRASDGQLVYSAPSAPSPDIQGGLRTMAVWARQADRLYFRDDTGVYTWDPSGPVSTFASGLRWEDPTLSSDDRYVTYTIWDAAGMQNSATGLIPAYIPHVEIRDLLTGKTATSPKWRSAIGFLSDAVLLETEDQGCTPHVCGVDGFVPSGKALALELNSGTEALLTPPGWRLADYWPHG